MRKPDRYDVAGFALGIVTFVVLLYFLGAYLGCTVETVCLFQFNGEQLGRFDCHEITGRLGGHFEGWEYHVEFGHQDVGCSDEVLGLMAEQFNVSIDNVTDCRYDCCITDGTCSGFPAHGVNTQMLSVWTR